MVHHFQASNISNPSILQFFNSLISRFAIISRNPQPEIESGCILYHEWLYSLVRLDTLERQTLPSLLWRLSYYIKGFSSVILLCFRF
jgi:hypothetical protein